MIESNIQDRSRGNVAWIRESEKTPVHDVFSPKVARNIVSVRSKLCAYEMGWDVTNDPDGIVDLNKFDKGRFGRGIMNICKCC